MAVGNFSSNTPGVPAVSASATAPGPGSNGVYANTRNDADSAVYGEHLAAGIGVFGRGGPNGGQGVFGQTASGASGVYGKSTGPSGPGVVGESASGNGVVGTSSSSSSASEDEGFGVIGRGITGVYGYSASGVGYGVYGVNEGGTTGVIGVCSNIGVGGVTSGSQGFGVAGFGGSSGTGVYGDSNSGTGIAGHSNSGNGITGESGPDGYNFGVVGTGPNAGVAAFNQKNNNAAYLASACCAAWFTGQVHVAGILTATQKKFQIDHPLDPQGKYLVHASVESSEMKNMYDGVSVLGSNGEAEVVLPAWFEVLNTDFRYQLTSIGGAAPNIHIAEEISNNCFKISGGVPGMKISWLVSGRRKDAWAAAHPLRVEQEKSAEERGYYLHPELYGATEERSIGLRLHPRPAPHVPPQRPTPITSAREARF